MDIKDLKRDYESQEMTKEQIEKMMNRINEAKQDNATDKKVVPFNRRKRVISRVAGIAAAFVLAFIALPNTSLKVAQAMDTIPGLGGLVSLVTFRDYELDTNDKSATIDRAYLKGSDPKSQEARDAINKDIEKYTEGIIKNFKQDLDQAGYENVNVSSQVVTYNQNYFTLKLTTTYQAADTVSEYRYYTIDMKTGKQVKLSDLFKDGDNYVDPISDNIKSQMKQEMKDKKDQSLYFLDEEDETSDNFQKIDAEQNFYINEDGKLVICFDQGQVAPMSTGSPSFVIPNDIFN